ncbi:MAG: phytanoyl-CoA dioxygenase family protein [Acidobacteriia bacterium]|nr:phytanoyl-CoA dioxygenase family protein [Terriglobia bacterium]
MTQEERYLFDLNGYLVLKNVLSQKILGLMNTAIDHLESLSEQELKFQNISRDYADDNVYAKVGKKTKQGHKDYCCNILTYGEPFENLIDWPVIMPYLQEMISAPLRIDAASFMSRNTGGGFVFHHGYAELLPYSEYIFDQGTFRCASIKISYALSDVGVEDGCFAVIPGSHKSNFQNPLVGQIPDPNHPLVQPISTQKGDAILFSEDLSHGALENRGGKVRRTLFYSYAPAFQTSWGETTQVGPGFETRATPQRIELVNGPPPFEDQLTKL